MPNTKLVRNIVLLSIVLMLILLLNMAGLFSVAVADDWVDNGFTGNITREKVGNVEFTNGTINGKRYQSTREKVGNVEIIRGNLGGEVFNCTSNKWRTLPDSRGCR